MKRIKVLVTAIALVMGITSTVYAELPFDREQGLIVVGDRAYSVDYLLRLNSGLDIKAINDRIAQNSSRVFYMNPNGEIYNTRNMSGTPITNERIFGSPQIIYTGATGEAVYVLNSGLGKYEEKVIQAQASVLSNQLGGDLKMVTITLKAEDVKNLTEYKIGYYKMENSPDLVPINRSVNYMSNSARNSEPIKIYSIDKKLIATGEVDISFTYGNTYKRSFTLVPYIDGAYGNAVGNINNNGLSAIDNAGVWTYYSNTADKGHLYKMKSDGMDNLLVAADEAKFINVIGDWIYFSNYSDGGKLYKVNVNGTGKTKICDDMASYINVSGDYIYYSNGSNGGKIYKINVTGNLNTRQELTSDMAEFINVDGNKIYYSNVSNNRRMYTVNTDGGSRVALPCEDSAMFICIQGDDIYYANYLDGGKIYRTKKGLSNGTKLTDDKTTSMNMIGGEIYFTSYSDNKNIYKMNKDGSGKTLVVKDNADYISISKDSLFYTKAGKMFVAQYSIDAYGQRVLGKPVAVVKTKDNSKIAKINDIIDNVKTKEELDNYKFPETIQAIMTDGSIKPVVVVWDKSKAINKNNIYTYTGTVLGYNNKVKLTVGVTASKAISLNDVVVMNNGGDIPDTIEVRGLKEGDTIYAYSSDDTSKAPIVTASVQTGSTFVKMETSLVKEGGSLWITVLRKPDPKDKLTPTQSVPLKVDYQAETNVPNSVVDVQLMNRNGAGDSITFQTGGTQPGDEIRVYKNQTDSTPINPANSGKVLTPGMPITINNLDFSDDDSGDKKLWYSVTGVGKTESVRRETKNTFLDSPDAKDVKLEASSAFSPIFATGDNPNSVKKNFTLPITGKVGTQLSWNSSNTEVISISNSTAFVKRPPLVGGAADAPVILTPNITKGRAKALGQPVNVTVLKMIEEDLIATDKENLSLEFSGSDNEQNVTANFLMPNKGINGSNITWDIPAKTTTGEINSFISKDSNGRVAIVKRPENGRGDMTIKLTATLNYNGKTSTKDFNITVRQLTGSQDILETAYNLLTVPSTINQPTISLGTIVPGQSGVTVEWMCDDTTISLMVGADGKQTGTAAISQPTYMQGPKKGVKLSAVLSSGQFTKTKDFTVEVHNSPATDDEAVQATGEQLSSFVVRNSNDKDENINTDLYLPTKTDESGFTVRELDGDKAATITWSSSDPTVIGTDGKVTKGSTDKVVTLKATITRGSATWYKTFIYTVKKR